MIGDLAYLSLFLYNLIIKILGVSLIKKFLFYLLTAAAFMLLISCSRPEKLESPPELAANSKIDGSELKIPTKLTSYSWGGKMTYGGPWDSFEKEKGITLEPGSTIEISFPKNPDELIVRQHTAASKFAIVDENNNTFTVPSQPGEYIYGISGTWLEGSALYGLKVEVK